MLECLPKAPGSISSTTVAAAAAITIINSNNNNNEDKRNITLETIEIIIWKIICQ